MGYPGVPGSMYGHSTTIYYKTKMTKTRQKRPKQSHKNTPYTTRQKQQKKTEMTKKVIKIQGNKK